ncbi:hypothetical protein LIER_17896 [Lithospermum erythrorhizon]|uniref:FAR1 domain-containing protein n=1 Tax=Lithospermum erythrorhizon TaxID=34254 RepID=A0AAV3QEK3_LITER
MPYAKKVGFGIRKSRGHKEHVIQVDRIICCTCEGEGGNDKREILMSRPHVRAITRCGCPAMMKISYRNNFGIYKDIRFVAVHNHVFSSPSNIVLHPCHRKFIPGQTTQIDMATCSGIPPKSGFELMVRQVGGRDNLDFISLDLLRSKQTERMLLGDTSVIMEYLQRMQTKDTNFFYAFQFPG